MINLRNRGKRPGRTLSLNQLWRNSGDPVTITQIKRILNRGTFTFICTGNTKKQILHSRRHQNRSPLRSQSCWSAESRRPGCRRGRSQRRFQRSPPCHGQCLGFCWREVKKESMSLGSPERRRPPHRPSADTPPSLPGHRCCCRGEGSLRRGEGEPQKSYEWTATDHWLLR